MSLYAPKLSAFVVNFHVGEDDKPTGFVSASCMLCDYKTRDFNNDESGPRAAVVQHIAEKHGRRRFMDVTR